LKILIDTNCWLWLQNNPSKIKKDTRDLLSNKKTQIFFSAASAWEISIKVTIGKLKLPMPPQDYMALRLNKDEYTELPVTIAHASRVHELPQHHKDPFDRILISQALCEGLSIVSSDGIFKKYPVKTIRV
jgi:PIN domain nuclease of toxin-antitoxin system